MKNASKVISSFILVSSLFLSGCIKQNPSQSGKDDPSVDPVEPGEDTKDFSLTLTKDEMFLGDTTHLSVNKEGNVSFSISPIVDDFEVKKDEQGKYYLSSESIYSAGIYRITASIGEEKAYQDLTIYRPETYSVPEMDIYTQLIDNPDVELKDLSGNPLTKAKVELKKKSSSKLNEKHLEVELTLNDNKIDLIVAQTVNGGREIRLSPSTYVSKFPSISVRPYRSETISNVRVTYDTLSFEVTNPDYVYPKKEMTRMEISIPAVDLFHSDLEVNKSFNVSLLAYDKDNKRLGDVDLEGVTYEVSKVNGGELSINQNSENKRVFSLIASTSGQYKIKGKITIGDNSLELEREFTVKGESSIDEDDFSRFDGKWSSDDNSYVLNLTYDNEELSGTFLIEGDLYKVKGDYATSDSLNLIVTDQVSSTDDYFDYEVNDEIKLRYDEDEPSLTYLNYYELKKEGK